MTTKPTPPSAARDKVRATVPKLIDLTEKVLFGDVWERPGLSKRDRSLITCAALVALNRTEQLKGHLERALNNGVTPDEIGELITHLAFYGGWPVAMSGALVAKEVSRAAQKVIRRKRIGASGPIPLAPRQAHFLPALLISTRRVLAL
jgi:4-carboxymuconolactone decarboxylase